MLRRKSAAKMETKPNIKEEAAEKGDADDKNAEPSAVGLKVPPCFSARPFWLFSIFIYIYLFYCSAFFIHTAGNERLDKTKRKEKKSYKIRNKNERIRSGDGFRRGAPWLYVCER